MAQATPTLVRTLGLRSVVLFGLAYMTPIIVLGIFGIIAEVTGGATPSAYLLALVAMLFTAFSYGRMAGAFPVAGSAYTYVRKCLDARAGFLVGWAVLLDYFFLPMVIWLFGAVYLQAKFPDVPFWVWVIAFIVTTSALNVVGVQTAAKVNFFLMAFQVLVIVLFVALSLAHVFRAGGATALVTTHPFVNSTTTWAGISAGAAIAAYSFLGFDAVTTLTEETIDARRTIPRAIMLTALIGGGIFVAVAYTTQLVHPGGAFTDSASAAFDIAQEIGGDIFGSIFLAGLVMAQYASGLAAQASVSRLLFAMGRDNVLPRKFFAFVHPKYHTPVLNLILSGLVGMLALWFDPATSTSFINFGAFTAFTFVNLSVIGYFLRERRKGTSHNPWAYVIAPAFGAVIDLWLLTQLDRNAITLGLGWLALGVVYLGVTTKGFRHSPPEMEFTEDVEIALPVRGG